MQDPVPDRLSPDPVCNGPGTLAWYREHIGSPLDQAVKPYISFEEVEAEFRRDRKRMVHPGRHVAAFSEEPAIHRAQHAVSTTSATTAL
jgi:hypothetical protein